MRRKYILCSMGKYVCFLAVCVVMLSSCYNDDDLKNSISGLEDRMDKLEASLQSVQTDISTLKTLTDALSQNKSIASVLENEDGSYTIKFSDKTEVTIRNGENGEDAPKITVIKNEEDGIYYWGITSTDGKKTFLKDGEGKMMPVTAAAPKIRINTNTKEWEISTDGGKTWEPTGVYASGEGTGDTSLFSGVSQDDDYAYFTLKDGTILKLSKSKELKCDILSGKQYFTNGEEKLISVEMSGISKYTVTKPDGWKASLTGKGLTITAPVAENQYAETSGKVAIMAVASNGQSIIAEIPVIIGDAPIVISTVGQTVSTTLTNGIETLEVIETDISRLQEVDGIGKKRIQMIRDSWERQKEIKNVMLFLQDHGVSTSFAAKIYRQYGNESLDKMKENPFQMADDIWGIGFKTADGIAQKLGFAKEAYVRLRSGIMYTLSNLADEGHVFAYQEQLIAKAAELLEAEESSIVMTLDQMIADKDLICETVDYKTDQAEMKAIYLPAFYYAEAGVAGKLKRLAQSPATDRLWHALMDARQKTGNESLSIDVGKIQEKVDMKYDEIQADAIRKAAVSKVMVLTGGPGTGKTTTTQGIIAAYRSFGLKILLAAPTGRAAKRMTEATGLEAKTIHRLLECKPPEGYQKNEDNPLDGDVLIIDECSMIDMILMNALLKAIPEGMRLILVGDIDQLPSVGAGNVLRDIIDSGVFPVVRLTRIFRQAQSSRIIMNAHAINEGKFPDISNGKNTDFFYIEKEDPEEAVQEIVRLVKNNLPRYYKTPWNHIQVLTPMQKGIVGAANLNLALQEALNPQGDGLRRGGYLFRTGDKVMQIRNNYEKEIFNGDIGTVESVDLQERTLKVNFDQHIIEYEASELDELVHAYATTIHKAQGSEYPIVVMPVLMNHYVMLQRNLIYTGITRAKKVLVIVGTRKALSYAVRNVTVTKRNTFLKERLSQA